MAATTKWAKGDEGMRREYFVGWVLLVGTVFAAACGADRPTVPSWDAHMAPHVRPSGIVLPKREFPTFTLFEDQPWWPRIISGLRKQDRVIARIERMTRFATHNDGDAGTRQAWQFIAPLIWRLEPLWSNEEWFDKELVMVSAASDFLNQQCGAPLVSFGDDAHKNRIALERILDWFRDLVADADALGRLADVRRGFDPPDGPHLGTPATDYESIPLVRTLDVGDRFQVDYRANDTQVVFALKRAGQTLWARTFMAERESHEVVRFRDVGVANLKRYGWRVTLRVSDKWAHVWAEAGKFLRTS